MEASPNPNSPETSRLVIDETFKASVDTTFQKLDEAKKQGLITPHVEMEHLEQFLGDGELAVIHSVFTLKPEQFGLTPPPLDPLPTPDKLVTVKPQPFFENGEAKMTKTHYLSPHVAEAFDDMATAMREDIARILLINDAYRTTTKQALVFLAYLRQNDYDLKKTAQRVALPGYSEHCTPDKLALDLQNTEGKPSDENPTDFEDTAEYKWLANNAHRFGFTLSYPKSGQKAEDGTELNDQGMMFEPWHWRWVGVDPALGHRV